MIRDAHGPGALIVQCLAAIYGLDSPLPGCVVEHRSRVVERKHSQRNIRAWFVAPGDLFEIQTRFVAQEADPPQPTHELAGSVRSVYWQIFAASSDNADAAPPLVECLISDEPRTPAPVAVRGLIRCPGWVIRPRPSADRNSNDHRGAAGENRIPPLAVHVERAFEDRRHGLGARCAWPPKRPTDTRRQAVK